MNLRIIERQAGCGRCPRGRNDTWPSDAKNRYSFSQSASELCASPTALKVCWRVQHDQHIRVAQTVPEHPLKILRRQKSVCVEKYVVDFAERKLNTPRA